MITFVKQPSDPLPSSSIEIINKSAIPIMFKVKTTQPKNYMVRPNMGTVQPSSSLIVSIKFNHALGSPEEEQACKNDKFLVQIAENKSAGPPGGINMSQQVDMTNA